MAERSSVEQGLIADCLDRVDAVLAEYERCCDPAPFTSERALYERICGAVGRPVLLATEHRSEQVG